MASIFDNKVVLITGGTGSFGHEFVRTLMQTAAARKIGTI